MHPSPWATVFRLLNEVMMKFQYRFTTPIALMVLATFIWGASYIFIKVALQEMQPSTFIFLRFLLAFFFMLPGCTYFSYKVNRLDVIRGTVLGLFLAGINFFQTIGMQTISASLSAFLTGTAVIFVLFIKLLLQKKLPCQSDWVIVMACILGLWLMTGSSGIVFNKGVWYTLLCACFVALHTYFLSDYAVGSDPFVLTLLQMAVLAVVVAPLVITLDSTLYLPTRPITWAALLLCAFFCSAVAFGLQSYAQQYIDAFQAAIILTLEPLFTLLFAQWSLGEAFQPRFYVGAGLLLSVVVLAHIRLKNIS